MASARHLVPPSTGNSLVGSTATNSGSPRPRSRSRGRARPSPSPSRPTSATPSSTSVSTSVTERVERIERAEREKERERGREPAPYLTHEVVHHGRRTLVPPDNAGRRRKGKNPKRREERREEEVRFNLGYPFKTARQARERRRQQQQQENADPPPPSYEATTAVPNVLVMNEHHAQEIPSPSAASFSSAATSLPIESSGPPPIPLSTRPDLPRASTDFEDRLSPQESIDEDSPNPTLSSSSKSSYGYEEKIADEVEYDDSGSNGGYEIVDLDPSQRWEKDREVGGLDVAILKEKGRLQEREKNTSPPTTPASTHAPTLAQLEKLEGRGKSPSPRKRLIQKLSVKIPSSIHNSAGSHASMQSTSTVSFASNTASTTPSTPGTMRTLFRSQSPPQPPQPQLPTPSTSKIALLRAHTFNRSSPMLPDPGNACVTPSQAPNPTSSSSSTGKGISLFSHAKGKAKARRGSEPASSFPPIPSEPSDDWEVLPTDVEGCPYEFNEGNKGVISKLRRRASRGMILQETAPQPGARPVLAELGEGRGRSSSQHRLDPSPLGQGEAQRAQQPSSSAPALGVKGHVRHYTSPTRFGDSGADWASAPPSPLPHRAAFQASSVSLSQVGHGSEAATPVRERTTPFLQRTMHLSSPVRLEFDRASDQRSAHSLSSPTSAVRTTPVPVPNPSAAIARRAERSCSPIRPGHVTSRSESAIHSIPLPPPSAIRTTPTIRPEDILRPHVPPVPPVPPIPQDLQLPAQASHSSQIPRAHTPQSDTLTLLHQVPASNSTFGPGPRPDLDLALDASLSLGLRDRHARARSVQREDSSTPTYSTVYADTSPPYTPHDPSASLPSLPMPAGSGAEDGDVTAMSTPTSTFSSATFGSAVGSVSPSTAVSAVSTPLMGLSALPPPPTPHSIAASIASLGSSETSSPRKHYPGRPLPQTPPRSPLAGSASPMQSWLAARTNTNGVPMTEGHRLRPSASAHNLTLGTGAGVGEVKLRPSASVQFLNGKKNTTSGRVAKRTNTGPGSGSDSVVPEGLLIDLSDDAQLAMHPTLSRFGGGAPLPPDLFDGAFDGPSGRDDPADDLDDDYDSSSEPATPKSARAWMARSAGAGSNSACSNHSVPSSAYGRFVAGVGSGVGPGVGTYGSAVSLASNRSADDMMEEFLSAPSTPLPAHAVLTPNAPLSVRLPIHEEVEAEEEEEEEFDNEDGEVDEDVSVTASYTSTPSLSRSTTRPQSIADDGEGPDVAAVLSRLSSGPGARADGSDYEALLMIADLLGPARRHSSLGGEGAVHGSSVGGSGEGRAGTGARVGQGGGEARTTRAERIEAALAACLVGRVDIERRRVLKDGRVKLKLSLLGISVDSCAICMSQFKEGQHSVLGMKCQHAFHERCVRVWLAGNRTCPLCRERLDCQ